MVCGPAFDLVGEPDAVLRAVEVGSGRTISKTLQGARGPSLRGILKTLRTTAGKRVNRCNRAGFR